MKLNARVLLALPCLAALMSVAGVAHANTIVNGSVWIDQGPNPNPNVYTLWTLPATLPSGAPATTFTLPNTTGIMNFYSGNGNYTIAGFLGSNGNTVPTLSNPAAGADLLNNTVWDFAGTTYMTQGDMYSVTHDDGMYLWVNGMQVISSGAPTPADTSSFTWTGTSGAYSFNLLYAEENGAPAVIDTNIAQTPEPSSFVLLGSGLLGVAGFIRRRMGA